MSEISNATCGPHCDQHAVIKLYCLRKKSTTKTYEKMKVVNGDACFLEQPCSCSAGTKCYRM